MARHGRTDVSGFRRAAQHLVESAEWRGWTTGLGHNAVSISPCAPCLMTAMCRPAANARGRLRILPYRDTLILLAGWRAVATRDDSALEMQLNWIEFNQCLLCLSELSPNPTRVHVPVLGFGWLLMLSPSAPHRRRTPPQHYDGCTHSSLTDVLGQPRRSARFRYTHGEAVICPLFARQTATPVSCSC